MSVHVHILLAACVYMSVLWTGFAEFPGYMWQILCMDFLSFSHWCNSGIHSSGMWLPFGCWLWRLLAVICFTCWPLKLFAILPFKTHQHSFWSVGDNHLSTTHPFMALFSTSSVCAPRILPHSTVGLQTSYPFTAWLHIAYISPSSTWCCHSSETSWHLKMNAVQSFKTFGTT